MVDEWGRVLQIHDMKETQKCLVLMHEKHECFRSTLDERGTNGCFGIQYDCNRVLKMQEIEVNRTSIDQGTWHGQSWKAMSNYCITAFYGNILTRFEPHPSIPIFCVS